MSASPSLLHRLRLVAQVVPSPGSGGFGCRRLGWLGWLWLGVAYSGLAWLNLAWLTLAWLRLIGCIGLIGLIGFGVFLQ